MNSDLSSTTSNNSKFYFKQTPRTKKDNEDEKEEKIDNEKVKETNGVKEPLNKPFMQQVKIKYFNDWYFLK